MNKNIFMMMIVFLVSIPQMALSGDKLDKKYKVKKDKYSADKYKFNIEKTNNDTPWHGEGEFGFYQMTGNIDHQNIIGRLKITYAKNSWKHNFRLNTVRTESNGKLDAEAYLLKFQTNYRLSEKHYLFSRLKYEDDKITNFSYQYSISAGYGINIFNTKTTGLSLDTGVGFRKNEIRTNNETTQEPIGVGQIIYFKKIGDYIKLTQELVLDIGGDDIYSESLTGLKVSITDAIAMKLSYLIKNHSESGDQEGIDVISAITLVYDF
jgi:putative salt-induced outer membrane protein